MPHQSLGSFGPREPDAQEAASGGPLVCHECWPKKTNHYEPCEHVQQMLRDVVSAVTEKAQEQVQAQLDTVNWLRTDAANLYEALRACLPNCGRGIPDCAGGHYVGAACCIARKAIATHERERAALDRAEG